MRLAEDFVSRVKIVHVSSPVFLSLGVSDTCRFRVLEIFFFSLFFRQHTYNKHINSKFFRTFRLFYVSLARSPSFSRPYVSLPSLSLSFLYSGGVKRLGELNICIETRLHRSCDGLLAWKQLRAGNEDQSRVYA